MFATGQVAGVGLACTWRSDVRPTVEANLVAITAVDNAGFPL